MPLLKRKPTPAVPKIDLTESDEKEVDSDEASELAALEEEETEEHGDFINDDPEDSDYEPSGESRTSSTASTQEDPMSPTRVGTLQEQIEMLIAQNKSLDHRVQQLLEKLEQKQN